MSIDPGPQSSCTPRTILEGIEVDFARLLEEAKELETHLQTLREQTKPVKQEAGVAVSVTSPDSGEFRVERREVVLLAQAREERVKLRGIGCAPFPHPLRNRAGGRVDELPRVD